MNQRMQARPSFRDQLPGVLREFLLLGLLWLLVARQCRAQQQQPPPPPPQPQPLPNQQPQQQVVVPNQGVQMFPGIASFPPQQATGQQLPPASTIVVPPPNPLLASVSQSGSDEVCGLNLKELRHDSRIVGGRNALRSEVPWMVHMRESHVFRMLGYNKCGGVLFNHRWVLTAAHCKPMFFSSLEMILGKHKTFEDAAPPEGSMIANLFKSGKNMLPASEAKPGPAGEIPRENEIDDGGATTNLKPLLGSGKSSSDGKRAPILQVLAETVIVHPDFDSKTLENDIALIKLKKHVPFREDIQPICLPDKDEDFTGLDGYATGWGLTDFTTRQLPEILQIVRLPIISNKKCQLMYRKSGHDKLITEQDLCAGYSQGGMDACEGDSGGPLIVRRPHEKRWVLAGVVSNGVKCGEPLLPGVYTRISRFIPWIQEQMRIYS